MPVFESEGGGEPAEGWEIDHLVVSTPNLSETVERLRSAGASLRRWGEASTGPTAFLRAGPVIELIDAGDPQIRLWGLAVATRLPLAEPAAAWRAPGAARTLAVHGEGGQSGRVRFRTEGIAAAEPRSEIETEHDLPEVHLGRLEGLEVDTE